MIEFLNQNPKLVEVLRAAQRVVVLRRMLGLAALGYALVHLLLYVAVEHFRLVHVAGEKPIFGADAVEWLGDTIAARGLELDLPPEPLQQPPSCRELPALGWVTENGGRWLRRCQRRPESPYRHAG